MRVRRRLHGRLLVAVFVTGVGLVANASTAHAHALLESSNPTDGATLQAAPPRLELRFSEAVLAPLTRVVLRDSGGWPVEDVGAVVVEQNHELVTATLPRLAPGAYRFDWRTVSADDLHAVSGTIVFGVQRSVTAAGSTYAPQPRPLEIGFGAIDVIASAWLVGAVAVWIWVVPPFARWLRRRDGLDSIIVLGRVDRVCLGLATAMSIVVLAASTMFAAVEIAPEAAPSGVGRMWSVLRTSSYGSWLFLRTLAMLAAVAVLLCERRRRARCLPTARPVGGQPGALLLLTWLALAFGAQTSHTAGAGARVITSVVTAHRIGASVWIGGVGVLAVLMLPRVAHLDRTARRVLVRRFGPLAAASGAVLVVSGLLLASRQVATVDALLQTFYGRTLVAKLIVVTIVGGFGARNVLALRRPARATVLPSTRSLSVEAVAGAAVLGLASVLTLAVPAKGAQFTGRPLDIPGSVTGEADDLLVSVAVRPNRPGQNYLTIDVHDTRRPAPAPIDVVTVSMSTEQRSIDEQARRVGDGQFEVVGDQFDHAGRWVVTVVVERPALRNAVLVAQWEVAPAVTRLPTKVSARPLAPILETMAMASMVIFVGTAALRLRKRRRVSALRLADRRENCALVGIEHRQKPLAVTVDGS